MTVNITLHQCKSLSELRKVFNTDPICRQYLEHILWNGTPVCPHCATTEKIYRLKGGKLFKCGTCKKQFTVTVGTIFERSHVSLQKWFEAIWCVTNKAKGIASTQLSDEIGVQQRTAWFMLGRIRFALSKRTFKVKMEGIVEVDEMFVGPEPSNMHEIKKKDLIVKKNVNMLKNNVPVVGILERGGDVLSVVVEKAEKRYVLPLIYKNVGDAMVMTDGSVLYKTLHRVYEHDTVNHSDKEYVRGNTHINSIEGHWGLFQRGLIGVYHHISKKHLQFYFNEHDFRHNVRKLERHEKLEKALNTVVGRLTYKQLINKQC